MQNKFSDGRMGIEIADRRAQRTHELIKNIFLTLLADKPIEKITVTEICRRADLNRSTFYQYYCDIYALFEDIKADFLQQTDQLMQEIISDVTTPSSEITMGVLDYIYQQKTLIYLLLFKYRQADFWEEIDQKILSLFRIKVLQAYTIPANITETVFEDTLLFLAAGFYAMYKRWIRDGCRADMETLATRTTELSLICLNNLLQPKNTIG